MTTTISGPSTAEGTPVRSASTSSTSSQGFSVEEDDWEAELADLIETAKEALRQRGGAGKGKEKAVEDELEGGADVVKLGDEQDRSAKKTIHQSRLYLVGVLMWCYHRSTLEVPLTVDVSAPSSRSEKESGPKDKWGEMPKPRLTKKQKVAVSWNCFSIYPMSSPN
jgi:hypothetical protein